MRSTATALLLPLCLLGGLQAAGAQVDTGPCKATDYNVVGLLELVSSSCSESRLARCWAGVEVRQCKEADREAGTDGNLALLPFVPLIVEAEPNSTGQAVAYTCPAGYGNIKSGSAAGFIEDEEGGKVEFTAFGSTQSHTIIININGGACGFEFLLKKATSDVLGTAPMEYGMSGAWRGGTGRAAAAVAAALAGAAAVLCLL